MKNSLAALQFETYHGKENFKSFCNNMTKQTLRFKQNTTSSTCRVDNLNFQIDHFSQLMNNCYT